MNLLYFILVSFVVCEITCLVVCGERLLRISPGKKEEDLPDLDKLLKK